MNKHIHITGTGTGVGKSVIVTALFRLLTNNGITVSITHINPQSPQPNSPTQSITLIEHEATVTRIAPDSRENVTFLVADNDRNNILATIYGTLFLLPPDERNAIKGLIINKWRGDTNQANSLTTQIHDVTGIPVLCTLPFLGTWDTDAENPWGENRRPLQAGILHYPNAELSEPATLGLHPAFSLRLIDHPDAMTEVDLVILPDCPPTHITKALRWIRRMRLDAAIHSTLASGDPIIGIGSGGVMLGTTPLPVSNTPDHQQREKGLGIIPAKIQQPFPASSSPASIPTINSVNKLTGLFSCLSDAEFPGRIVAPLLSETAYSRASFASIKTNDHLLAEGLAINNTLVTAVHGLFESPSIRAKLAGELLFRKGLGNHARNSERSKRQDPISVELEKILSLIPFFKTNRD